MATASYSSSIMESIVEWSDIIVIVIVMVITIVPMFQIVSYGLSMKATRILFSNFTIFSVSMDNKIITIYILQMIQNLFHVFMYLWRWCDVTLVFLLMLVLMMNGICFTTIRILFNKFTTCNILTNGQTESIEFYFI